jgi:methylglutaconyl-CoA hydratase
VCHTQVAADGGSGSIRAAVLTCAAGSKSFSAGADLSWMKKMAGYSKEQNETDSHQLFDMFAAVANCSVPVVGRIAGAAFGGGCGLVAACDMSFALSSAQFAFTVRTNTTDRPFAGADAVQCR